MLVEMLNHGGSDSGNDKECDPEKKNDDGATPPYKNQLENLRPLRIRLSADDDRVCTFCGSIDACEVWQIWMQDPFERKTYFPVTEYMLCTKGSARNPGGGDPCGVSLYRALLGLKCPFVGACMIGFANVFLAEGHPNRRRKPDCTPGGLCMCLRTTELS